MDQRRPRLLLNVEQFSAHYFYYQRLWGAQLQSKHLTLLKQISVGLKHFPVLLVRAIYLPATRNLGV